LGPVD